jgi:hypothetical protein
MITTSKCRIIPEYQNLIKKFNKGINVYFFNPEITQLNVKTETVQTKTIGNIEMLLIHGGMFIMGSPDNEKVDRDSNESLIILNYHLFI